VWLLRALAFCFCWYWIFSAVRANSFLPAFFPKDHDCTKAAAAVRIWQTVSSGFFPPLLPQAFQEQMTDGGQGLVSHQAAIVSAFVMIEPQFAFLVFETAFHMPTREGHQQQRLHTCFGGRVADKVFDLIGLENAARHQQVAALAGIAVVAGNTLVVEPQAMIEKADAAGLFVVGLSA